MADALPTCRWRGEERAPGRFGFGSPKLVVFSPGVDAGTCQRCYCRDHEPVAPAAPARPRTLECFHLGDVLDRRGCHCPVKWLRECDVHGRCTLGDAAAGAACCATCREYTDRPP